MFKLSKGEFGYRKRLKQRYLLYFVLMIVFIGLELYARQFFNEKLQKLLLVMILLTALPAALMISRLIAISRFKTLSKEIYSEYAVFEGSFPVLYELLLTTTDYILPMDVIAVHPTGGIYAYCSNPKVRVQKAEDEINGTLRDQNLNFKIRISADKKTFDKRIKSLKPSTEYEANEKMDTAIAVLKAMSM